MRATRVTGHGAQVVECGSWGGVTVVEARSRSRGGTSREAGSQSQRGVRSREATPVAKQAARRQRRKGGL